MTSHTSCFASLSKMCVNVTIYINISMFVLPKPLHTSTIAVKHAKLLPIGCEQLLGWRDAGLSLKCPVILSLLCPVEWQGIFSVLPACRDWGLQHLPRSHSSSHELILQPHSSSITGAIEVWINYQSWGMVLTNICIGAGCSTCYATSGTMRKFG